MNKSPDRKELQYITPQGDYPGGFEGVDIAQDPDEIFQQQRPQVPDGQETEPHIKVLWRKTGRLRKQTIGPSLQQGERSWEPQDAYQTDITIFEDEGTGQWRAEATSDVLDRFQETGVRASDFPVNPTQQPDDPVDFAGAQITTIKKQPGGASMKHTPAGGGGSRLKPVTK